MSQNSPAKHERIERHLMRQRGAGTRTVNVEFGFSFAGFSAPSSSQVTPSSVPTPNEPPTKRRRTTEDDQGERELARTNALDRRGQTKARSKKKRFEIGAEDELKRSERVSKQNGDDSFVAGCNVKTKQSKAEQTPTLAQPGPIAPKEEDAPRDKEHEETIKHERTTRPRKGGVTAVDGGVSSRRIAAPVTSRETVSRARRPIKKSTPAVQQDANKAAEAEVEEQPASAKPRSRKATKRKPHTTVDQNSTKAELSTEAKPRPKKRATRKVAREDTATNECHHTGLTAEEVEAPVIGPRKRARKRAVESFPEHGTGTLPSASTATRLPKPFSGQQKAAPKRKKVDQRPVDDAERQGFASNYIAAEQDAEKDAEQDDLVAPEGQKSGRAGEGNTCNRQRTRTTKRTAKRKANVLSDPHSEDGNLAVRPTKKASQPTSEVASKPTTLQSTPPQLERRPLQQADANRSPAPRKPPEKLNDKVVEDAASAASRKRKRKAAVDEEPVAEQRAKMPAKVKSVEQPEEEDIDWLFAAPESRFNAPSVKSTTNKASSAPRKTKLVDMDLDDLIANVAAFAQPGDATNRDIAGGPARKARGR